VTAGLIWRLAGDLIEAIGADHVRLSEGRTMARKEAGWKRIEADAELTR
jgi:hypothetical protein